MSALQAPQALLAAALSPKGGLLTTVDVGLQIWNVDSEKLSYVGKRLFDKGTIPTAYTLVDSKTSPSGVMVTTLKRAGEVQAGSF